MVLDGAPHLLNTRFIGFPTRGELFRPLLGLRRCHFVFQNPDN